MYSIIHPRITSLPSVTHPHVIPNLQNFFSTISDILKECFCPYNENQSKTTLDVIFIVWIKQEKLYFDMNAVHSFDVRFPLHYFFFQCMNNCSKSIHSYTFTWTRSKKLLTDLCESLFLNLLFIQNNEVLYSHHYAIFTYCIYKLFYFTFIYFNNTSSSNTALMIYCALLSFLLSFWKPGSPSDNILLLYGKEQYCKRKRYVLQNIISLLFLFHI